MTAPQLIARLRSLGTVRTRASCRRFGIVSADEILGVSIPEVRLLARAHRRDHALAAKLWASGIFEARILAALVDDPAQVTRRQMDQWARGCDNWAVTDACCGNLFDRTAFAREKALAWSGRRAEFVKRCGFVLMAGMAVHRKELPDAVFLEFLPVIRRESKDGRNFVRKAVNWALRQIGKRNSRLRLAAIAEAKTIRQIDSPAARWIAADALRELAANPPPKRQG
jgi:3-methyladenine DNA glycosylase AlkD